MAGIRAVRRGLGVCMMAAAVSCGGGGAASAQEPAPVIGPAPAALQGSWLTTLQPSNEQLTMTLTEGAFSFSGPDNSSTGAIGVQGDQIEFSQGSLCAGLGFYQWSISGTALP